MYDTAMLSRCHRWMIGAKRTIIFILLAGIHNNSVHCWMFVHHRLSLFSLQQKQQPFAHQQCDLRSPTSPLVRVRSSVSGSGATNADEDSQYDDNTPDIAPVVASDAEALLACRAYLRKRKKLGGWTQQQRRKYLREQQQPTPSTTSADASSSKITSFAVYNKPDDRLSETIQDDSNDNNDDEKDEFSEELAIPSTRASIPFEQIVMFGPTPTLEWAESFISAPVAPSLSHQRRSRAALKRFQHPAWKAFWYQARFGSKPKLSSSSRTQEQQERQRIRRIQRFQQELMNSRNLEELLSLDDWESMTPADMEQAIRTYISSYQDRAISRQATLQGRRQALQENWNQVREAALAYVTNNTAVTNTTNKSSQTPTRQPPTKEALLQARRKRAEDSRRRYQKRLENDQQRNVAQLGASSKQKPPPALAIPTLSYTNQRYLGRSPKDAMMRIQEVLQRFPQPPSVSKTAITAPATASDDQSAKPTPSTAAVYPSIADVELMLAPERLAGRKELLRRILSECFQMRGKCVPPFDTLLELQEQPPGHRRLNQSNMDNCLFVTQCSLDHLGKFILHLLSLQQQLAVTTNDAAPSTPVKTKATSSKNQAKT